MDTRIIKVLDPSGQPNIKKTNGFLFCFFHGKIKDMEKYSEERPWGRFERFCLNEPCTVKLHFIKPGEEFSLQSHKNRSEFFRIICGQGEVTIGDEIKEAKKDDEFFINKEIKHRIKAGEKGIEVLEISFGEFEEEDEIRFEDKYNRQ